MAIKYADQSFVGFQDYLENYTSKGMAGADATPLYAHPVDEWILRTLNSTPAKALLNKAMDALVSWQFGMQLASGVFIDQKSFPDLFEVLSHSAKTLGIPIPHAVASNAPGLFNAYTAGTDDYAFINIAATLCQVYSKEEACFVIGHECGHIHSNHMIYQTLVNVLTNNIPIRMGYLGYALRLSIGVALQAWSRRAEVTGDRAGLLCVGDLRIAERALLRLVTGLADVDRVDMEDYLRRSRGVEDFHPSAEFMALFTTHPLIPKRIEALRLFANSELYYSLMDKPAPEGVKLLNREELDRRTNQIIAP